MREALYPWSGQDRCFDAQGRGLDCRDSGQDAEFRPGRPWPVPRFELVGAKLVRDRLTGLVWPRTANPAAWPMNHEEALGFVAQSRETVWLGRADWRLPTRRELLSLVSLAHAKPALPPGHPFEGVFAHWCWTAQASRVAPGHFWRVDLEGGRMFSGPATAEHLVWPVAGQSWLAPESPAEAERLKRPWPTPRFEAHGDHCLDLLTGLTWSTRVQPVGQDRSWDQALYAAKQAGAPWRLPTIFELETLVDISQAWPALPEAHPFEGMAQAAGAPSAQVGDTDDARLSGPASGLGLWSSTTSGFDPAWAWVLYTGKGAVGVGHKGGTAFRYLLIKV